MEKRFWRLRATFDSHSHFAADCQTFHRLASICQSAALTASAFSSPCNLDLPLGHDTHTPSTLAQRLRDAIKARDDALQCLTEARRCEQEADLFPLRSRLAYFDCWRLLPPSLISDPVFQQLQRSTSSSALFRRAWAHFCSMEHIQFWAELTRTDVLSFLITLMAEIHHISIAFSQPILLPERWCTSLTKSFDITFHLGANFISTQFIDFSSPYKPLRPPQLNPPPPPPQIGHERSARRCPIYPRI